MDQNKITFIGFGNMGSAIYNGMQKSKLTNEVLIVDDGSDQKIDNSYECLMITNNSNRGKGYSITRAMEFAKENNFTHILIETNKTSVAVTKAKILVGNIFKFKKLPI